VEDVEFEHPLFRGEGERSGGGTRKNLVPRVGSNGSTRDSSLDTFRRGDSAVLEGFLPQRKGGLGLSYLKGGAKILGGGRVFPTREAFRINYRRFLILCKKVSSSKRAQFNRKKKESSRKEGKRTPKLISSTSRKRRTGSGEKEVSRFCWAIAEAESDSFR